MALLQEMSLFFCIYSFWTKLFGFLIFFLYFCHHILFRWIDYEIFLFLLFVMGLFGPYVMFLDNGGGVGRYYKHDTT